ncbi:TPA: hypothetical protein H4H95_002518 [Escherichia coli]|nr:hypothetical protein [Escherichia coli]HAL1009890.1 hypothetical protein [Escherichia coli]
MKIICLEENYLDSELGRACMPVALEQAPFLGYPSGSSVLMTDYHWLQRVCHAR